MQAAGKNRPDFMIIGAQKSGTTWLWRMLDQHPGTDLPETKEIHYFGGIEKHQQGPEWYYAHFDGLDTSKVIGEASTTYLYDTIPYFYNDSRQIETDSSYPPIPELITNEFPDIKIIITLRNPVKRAVSAYKHWMRRQFKEKDGVPPNLGIEKTGLEYPKMRILEYGYYARYIKCWQRYVPPERMRIYIFEEDIIKTPEATLTDVYNFLGLESSFRPPALREPVHQTWSLTRSYLRYYADPVSRRLLGSRLFNIVDKLDFLESRSIKASDIPFLKTHYKPHIEALEALLERDLSSWKA